MDNFRKLRVTVWKNWLFRRRQYMMTSFEIILPTLFSALLVLMRTQGGEDLSVKYINNYTTYKAENVWHSIAPSFRRILRNDKGKYEYWPRQTHCTVIYAPNNDSCRDLLYYFNQSVLSIFQVDYLGMNDEKEMEGWISNTNNTLLVGISFLDYPHDGSLPNNLNYRIRLPGEEFWNWQTNLLAPPYALPGPLSDIPRYYDGFLVIQHIIALRFIEKVADKTNLLSKTQVSKQRYPYPPYYQDNGFSELMQSILPLFITLSYVFISPTLIKYVVREKELGVKELMKLMGLPGWIQWFGWFLSSFIMMTLSAVIIVALLCAKFDDLAVISYTAPELLFLILLLYIISAICFCFFITSFFSKPTLATAIGVLVWLLSFFVPFYVLNPRYQDLNLCTKMSVSLFPNMALAWIVRFMISFEGRQIGLQWSNLNEPSYQGDNMTVVHILVMFGIDIVLYIFLTWYMDHVSPGIYGVSKPWYFIFTKSYWCGNLPSGISLVYEQDRKSINFENEPTGLEPTITIHNLTKVYNWNSKGKIAVDNLNLKIYEGQITALLGHNGAGKTTTMSMLTGMFPPTSGTAYIYGCDIRTDIDSAREDLGLCPQHNMLFSTLTVKEHLQFFGKLKKMSNKALNNEITQLLHKLQLWDKKDTLSMSLSGGMKRKLNLGIALIGKPKIIMLDEPTSGMDPEARRAIWDLLLEIRPGRCIVLTTHFMEEADVLGDRIAIMARGQVECCGSPLFLKKRYGAGYHLNISKSDKCRISDVVNLIQGHVSGAHIKTNTINELCVILPTENTQKFPVLFDDLERNFETLGVINFGMSVTTMEEVFLKVGETYEIEENVNGLYNSTSRDALTEVENDVGSRRAKQSSRLLLWLKMVFGLLLKRWYYSRRRWILLISQVVLPVVMVTVVLLLNNRLDAISFDNPPLTMDITQYGSTTAFYKEQTEKFHDSYMASFPRGTAFKDMEEEDPQEFLKRLGHENYRTYQKEYIVGADFSESTESTMKANAWFNGLYYHTQPLSLNLVHNAMAKQYAKSNNYSLVVENYPFPADLGKTTIRNQAVTILKSIMMGMFIPVGLSFLSSSFIVFPIHERATKSKHLQLMTGVGGLFFWGTSFIWDFLTHIVCSLIILVVFANVDDTGAFSGGDKSGVVFLLLLLYGWAAIPFTYLISFVASLPATGFSRLTVINLMAGIILSVTMFMFQMAGSDSLKNIGEILQWFFRFLPNYTVTIGFMNMVRVSAINDVCDKFQLCSMFVRSDYLQWDLPGIGQELFMLGVSGLAYFILLAMIERGVFYSFWYFICNFFKSITKRKSRVVDEERTEVVNLDVDVASERTRVQRMVLQGNQAEDVLVVHDLSKQFWRFKAVDHLNFGVRNAECFGLLGVNGAGKTTTFQMLTGVLVMTSGNAYTKGISLKGERPKFLEQIGYCPQFDALLDYLTGREMLTVFSHLRGIPNNQIKRTVDEFIKKFDLTEHADKITLVYSGGNKRKLSAALAFIGDPPMVFLDEPTTGVDPVARRKIWDILTTATQVGTSVVLTSHSMEECEVLCSRVAIMVNGQFQCLGGIQYLKNKFSQGFNIMAKLKRLGNADEDERLQAELCHFMAGKFPTATLKDVHQGLVQYHVSDVTTKWTYLFATMEDAKFRFNLEDYSVSQATLEQVFLSFARRQRTVQNTDKKSD